MTTCTRPIEADAAACAISRNPLLRDLNAETLTPLLRNIRRIDCDRGHILNHPGKAVEHLFLVLTGTISRSMVTDSGVERVLDLFGPNELCGLSDLFSCRDTPIQHIVVEPGILIAIPLGNMRSACEKSPTLAWRMASHLARRQLAVEDEMVSSQLLTANDRVMNFLQSLSRQTAGSRDACLHLPASKQLVAARLGMTPESFSRALRDLTNANRISVQGRTIVLRRLDPQRSAQDDARLLPGDGSRGPAPAPHPCPPARAASLHLAELINLSGRQRMLSERMAKAWMMIGRNISPVKARRLLHQSISLYERQRAVLAVAGHKHVLAELLRREARCWPRYRRLLLETPRRERMDSLLAANADIVDIAERATYELARNPDRNGALINLAGRQRMLVQRMAKNYLGRLWVRNHADYDSAIKRDRDAFTSELEHLAECIQDTPSAQTQLGQVRLQWLGLQQFFVSEGHAIDDDTLGGAMASASERLVEEIDATVTNLVNRCAGLPLQRAQELLAA